MVAHQPIRRIDAHQSVSHAIRIVNGVLGTKHSREHPGCVYLSFIYTFGAHRRSATLETNTNKARAQIHEYAMPVAPDRIPSMVCRGLIPHDPICSSKSVDDIVIQAVLSRIFTPCS